MSKLTQESLTWPLVAECGVCGGELRIYPYPAPTGSGLCAKCSPLWLEDFLVYATRTTAKYGWKAAETAEENAERLAS